MKQLQPTSRREAISLYSMSQTYPCKECRETVYKACRFRNQQKTHSGEKPCGCTVCHRHIPVNNVMRYFRKPVGLGTNKRYIQERSHFLVRSHFCQNVLSCFNCIYYYETKFVFMHHGMCQHVKVTVNTLKNYKELLLDKR